MSDARPATPARKGRPGYDRQGVLDVAVTAFNERGYEATSMGMIGDRLGLTKASIYHHFDSKAAMLQAALDAALDGLEAQVDQLPAGAPAMQQLEQLIRGAVHVLTGQLPYVTLLLRLRGNTELEQEALERRRGFDRRVSVLVADAQREGALRQDISPQVASRLVFGMINSVAEWFDPNGSESADQLTDDILALALDGLRSPGVA